MTTPGYGEELVKPHMCCVLAVSAQPRDVLAAPGKTRCLSSRKCVAGDALSGIQDLSFRIKYSQVGLREVESGATPGAM